jgi:hypothetical protein
VLKPDAVKARPWERRTFWVGVAIFVVAAALRLALVQSARFTGDEASDYAIGMDIAHGVNFPLLGPIITNGPARHPGPLFYWMAAFPQLFTRAPEAGNVFFELLGAATVWMFWCGLRRPFGEAGAAFAALLMACSPWSILFGDRVWNPHGFLFFEALAILAVLKLRECPRSAWAMVLPGACLALPQFHMSAPVVWLALIPLGLHGVRAWNRRYLAIGIGLALLLCLPLALHEARTGLGNTRAFLAEMGSVKKHAPATVGFLLTPVYAIRFLTLDVTYHELTGYWGGLDESAAWRALWSGSPARPFHLLRLLALLVSGAMLLLAAGVAAAAAVRRGLRNGWRSALGPFGSSALLALALDVALLAGTHQRVFAHYVVAVLPFIFVLYAALGRRALRTPRFAAVVLALGAIFCIGGVEATLSISRRIDGRNGLAVHRAVARRFLNDCAAESRNPATQPVRLDADFTSSPYAYGVFARYALVPPIRWADGPGSLLYLLRRSEEPAPLGSDRFPVEPLGPVTLYRTR